MIMSIGNEDGTGIMLGAVLLEVRTVAYAAWDFVFSTSGVSNLRTECL
jgi:hypothetical protein